MSTFLMLSKMFTNAKKGDKIYIEEIVRGYFYEAYLFRCVTRGNRLVHAT